MGRTFENHALEPHQKKQWSIPPQSNAEFVWRMEDVPEVYTRPYRSTPAPDLHG